MREYEVWKKGGKGGETERRKERRKDVRKEEIPQILVMNGAGYEIVDPMSITVSLPQTTFSHLSDITPSERHKSKDKIMEFYFPLKGINNGNTRKSWMLVL